MRRRALLGSATAAIGTAGCLSTITGDESVVQLRYLEVENHADDPETFHLILRTEDGIDYWSSIEVEPNRGRRICDDWTDEASSLELLVRRDEQSDWKSRELAADEDCLGVVYSEMRGFGFYVSSCRSSCPGESDSVSDRNETDSSTDLDDESPDDENESDSETGTS